MAELETPLGDVLSLRLAKKQKDAEKAAMSRKDRYDFADGGPGQGAGGVPMDRSKTFGSRTSGPAQKRPSGKGNPVVAPAASEGPPKPKMKPASDKSSQAGKMTSFQRMKARQYEKEGVAGRSMTRSAAQKKAIEKSGGPKISFSAIKDRLSSAVKPKASDKKPKPLTSAFAKKNLAANQAIGKKK